MDTSDSDLPAGTLKAIDRARSVIWYWSAPAEYLGDKASFIGQQLSYEFKTSGVGPRGEYPDVKLVSDEYELAFWHERLSLGKEEWTPFRVPLVFEAEWRHSETGVRATEAEFDATLSDLTDLLIRGEYKSGPDTGWLRAVSLGAPDPEARLRIESAETLRADLNSLKERHADLLESVWLQHAVSKHLTTALEAVPRLVGADGTANPEAVDDFHWGLEMLEAAFDGLRDHSGTDEQREARKPQRKEYTDIVKELKALRDRANAIDGLTAITVRGLDKKANVEQAQTYGRIMVRRVRRCLYQKPLDNVNSVGKKEIDKLTEGPLGDLEIAIEQLDPNAKVREFKASLKKVKNCARLVDDSLEKLRGTHKWAEGRSNAARVLIDDVADKVGGLNSKYRNG